MTEDKHKKIRVEKTDEEPKHGTVNEIEEYERRRALRIVAVVCAVIFTTLLSVVVGAGLALWDMDKTPKDLIAAVTDKGEVAVQTEEDTGLTFIDPEEEENDGDTGLVFIDPEAEDEPLDGEGDDSTGNLTKAGDVLSDGSIVVSAELASVAGIMRAGSDQMMAVTALAQTNVTDPNESYPLPFQAVDESYFNDALFIGDSRLHGFGMWSGLPGTYYTVTGFQLYDYKNKKVVQTGNGKVPIFSALPYNAFTKIYIKVGLNEMGWGTEAGFEEVYAQLISELRAMEPRAIIYIHAVLPVTAAKSASDRSHNNPNIIARNSALKQFAVDQKAYFIDPGPVVSDESGCLKPEMTGDGIHLTSRYMGVWKQYLIEHAVVVPEVPEFGEGNAENNGEAALQENVSETPVENGDATNEQSGDFQ